MLRNDQRGGLQPLALPFAIVVVLLIVMTGLSMWSYTQYTSQRDNVNAKVTNAVEEAKTQLTTELETEFEEREKSPLSTYQSSAALGSITIKYPRNWSAYIDEDEGSRNPGINAYFHPRYVPEVKSGTAYALRLQLLSKSYNSSLKGPLKLVEDKEATSTPIKISGVQGLRIDGKIGNNSEGAMILMPIRDKTLRVYTLSTNYLNDFDNFIVKNLKFIP